MTKNLTNIQLPEAFQKNTRIISGISSKPSEEKKLSEEEIMDNVRKQL